MELGEMLGAAQMNISRTTRGGLGTDSLTTKITDTLDGGDIYSSVAALAAATGMSCRVTSAATEKACMPVAVATTSTTA